MSLCPLSFGRWHRAFLAVSSDCGTAASASAAPTTGAERAGGAVGRQRALLAGAVWRQLQAARAELRTPSMSVAAALSPVAGACELRGGGSLCDCHSASPHIMHDLMHAQMPRYLGRRCGDA